MTLGTLPLTSRAGSGEPPGTAEGVPPRPVGDAPSVGVVDGLDPMVPFRLGEVRNTAPSASTTVAATASTPASAIRPIQRRPPEPPRRSGGSRRRARARSAGRAAVAVGASPRPRLGRARRVRHRRAVRRRRRVGSDLVPSGHLGVQRTAPRAMSSSVAAAGDAVASRSRSVLWARLRMDPTLPGLVRRNEPISA